jgi:HK97 family phage prohead protease
VERKSIEFKLTDLDKSKRTAIIAHAAYDNIDRTQDISRKGMFDKTWSENKNDLFFYLNHNDQQAPGKVVDVFDDNQYAYTKAWLGTHTLGNDVLTMMDEGVIKSASFGYVATKSNRIEVKGKKVRELKEVIHLETSVLTMMPANQRAGVVSVTKAFSSIKREEVADMEQHVIALEKFCRNTKASDMCIKSMLTELENMKQLIAEYNTALTLEDEPGASVGWKSWLSSINQLQKN